ncbi:MAG: hypothetical protein WAQ12_04775 [Tissierellaceae bacterium]|nr:hypothetical protein [Tissierellia bacterium]
MKRKGFISVMALLLLTVILASSTYMLYIFSTQTTIASNSHKNIQARIATEDKAKRLIYDEESFNNLVLPEIYHIMRNKNPPYKNTLTSNNMPASNKITLPSDSPLASNVKSATIRLEGSDSMLQRQVVPDNYHETTSLILRLETDYQGVKNLVEFKGRVINRLFEIEEAFVTQDRLEDEELVDEFHSLMDLIKAEIFKHDAKGTPSAIAMNFDGDVTIDEKYITGSLGDTNNFYGHTGKHVFINVKNLKDERPSLEVKHQTDPNRLIKIRGNIYCEGDLVISSPFELEGNLILNGGSLTLNTNEKPLVKGKVFFRGEGDLKFEDIKLKTEKKYVYRFGSYLPGFIDVEIIVIKKQK